MFDELKHEHVAFFCLILFFTSCTTRYGFFNLLGLRIQLNTLGIVAHIFASGIVKGATVSTLAFRLICGFVRGDLIDDDISRRASLGLLVLINFFESEKNLLFDAP